MRYNNEVFEEAKKVLEQKRRDAELAASHQKEMFFIANPKARVLQDSLGTTGSRAALAVLKGGDVKEQLQKLRDENLRCQREFNEILKENGITKEDISPKYSCAKCSDTGYINNKMCDCLKNLLKKITFEKLNQISPLRLSSFENYSLRYFDEFSAEQKAKMLKVSKYCKYYADNFATSANSLLFTGGTGLGKTHLSLAIAGEAINKGFGVVYGSVQSFASAIERERFKTDEESGTDRYLAEADLLILDDLGTEFPSPYVSSVIYNIVDTRIMRNLPTIISTNLSLTEIQNRYGERLVSRIFGCFDRLDFVGSDVRILKKRLGIKA